MKFVLEGLTHGASYVKYILWSNVYIMCKNMHLDKLVCISTINLIPTKLTINLYWPLHACLQVHIYNVQHNYSTQDEYSSQIGCSSKKGAIAIEQVLRSTLSYLPHQICEDFAREHQI